MWRTLGIHHFNIRGFKCLKGTPEVGDFLSLVALLRHEFVPCIVKADGGRESLILRINKSETG